MNGAIPAGQYVLGWALLGVTLACTGGVAAIVVRRRLDHLRGAPRAVAFALLWIAVTLLVHLLPLVVGVLSRATVPATAVALLVAVRSMVPGLTDQTPEPPPAESPRSGAASLALAGAGALLTVAYSVAFLHNFATVHPVGIDALNFHFPGVIRFIQSGTLWQNTEYSPGLAFGNYPQYGDLLLLAVVLPWHSLALIRFVDPLLLFVAALAVYAIGRELCAPASTAVLAACAVVSIKPALSTALVDVMTDPTFLACFAAGTLFLLRHWRTGWRSDLLLAGLGLGIAFGTKWYGLSDVPGLVLIWAVVGLTARRGVRRVGADAGAVIVTVALAGGIWLVRNAILTGNPVFDYNVSLFGTTIFSAPHSAIRAAGGFSIAHYLGSPHILRTLVWPVWRGDFGVAGGLIAAGAGLGGLTALMPAIRRRAARVDPRIALLAVAALVLAVAYVITPFSAQGPPGRPLQVNANTRYGVPALLLAAPTLAWVAGRLGAARLAIEAALLAVIAVNLHRHLAVGVGHVLLAAALAAALVAAWRTRSALRRIVPRAAAVVSAGTALVACGVVGLGYHYERVLGRTPYVPNDPAVEYVLAHSPADTRIGLTGIWSVQGLVPVAVLFGPRLSNHVYYVGRFIDHMLRQYTTAQEFISALRRGHYPLLMVGTGSPPSRFIPQETLAREAGYFPVARSARLVLLAARA